MKLEDQVSNLELSKRLKELGVKQDSFFIWEKRGNKNWKLRIDCSKLSEYYAKGEDYDGCPDIFTYLGCETEYYSIEQCSAFTVAELGEMMPFMLKKNGREWILSITKQGEDFWCVTYRFEGFGWGECHHSGHVLADCLAKMLIWLIENGKVKV